MKHSTHAFTAVLLIFCMLLCSCGGKTPETESAAASQASAEATTAEVPTTLAPSTQASTEEATTAPQTTEEPTTEAPTEPAPEPITIEPAVLVDDEPIKITARGFHQSEEAQGLNLTIQNNTDRELALCCSSLIINDYMFTEPAAIRVAANNSAYDELTVSSEELLARGISEIAKMEIDFKVIDPETGETVDNPLLLEVKTSCYDSMSSKTDWDGPVLYDDNDLRILLAGTETLETGGSRIDLYLENHAEKDISLVGENVTVNGRVLEAPFLSTVAAGKKALASLTISRSSKEKLNITGELDTVELSLLARDAGDWKVLFDTGAMTAEVSGKAPVFDGMDNTDSSYIPEKLILDEEGIKLQTLGYFTAAQTERDPSKVNALGQGLKLKLENSSDKAVRFLIDTVVVDNYVLNGCGLTLKLDAGASTEAALFLDPDLLKLIGIEKFGTIELYCLTQDPESGEVLKRFDPVSVETSAVKDVEIIEEQKGAEVYNENNLQVVVIGYSFSENAGAKLYLWVKNTSDKTMVLTPVNVSVNKTPVLGFGDLNLKPGKMTIGTVIVPASEITSHAVQEFRGMIFASEVYDEAGNYQFTTLHGGVELN